MEIPSGRGSQNPKLTNWNLGRGLVIPKEPLN